MATAEIEEVEVFFDRINRIYRIEIGEVEETFDIGDFNLRAKLAKIRIVSRPSPLRRLAKIRPPTRLCLYSKKPRSG